MTEKSLSYIAGKMRDIDIAMLSTHTKGGRIGSRPMSNNREVEYDGNSYYFTWEKSLMISDIEADPNVSLAFQGEDGFFLAVEGKAEISRDKDSFRQHWKAEFDKWFEDGINTEGVAMITVHAERATCWQGMEETEVTL